MSKVPCRRATHTARSAAGMARIPRTERPPRGRAVHSAPSPPRPPRISRDSHRGRSFRPFSAGARRAFRPFLAACCGGLLIWSIPRRRRLHTHDRSRNSRSCKQFGRMRNPRENETGAKRTLRDVRAIRRSGVPYNGRVVGASPPSSMKRMRSSRRGAVTISSKSGVFMPSATYTT